jgi:hypothetical protein
MKRLVALLFSVALLCGQNFSLRAAAAVFSVPPSSKEVNAAADQTPTITLHRIVQKLDGVYIGSMANSGEISDGQIGQSNCLNIDHGNLLLNPDVDICIGTHEANIYIKAGAMIFLMDSGKDLVLYDLYQSKANQVAVVTDKDKLALKPGQMLVLTRESTNDFGALTIKCHSVGYRRAQQIQLHTDLVKGFAAEFSIISAIAKIEPLKRLTVSMDKKDTAVIEKLLKNGIMLRNSNGATRSCLAQNLRP